MSPIPKEYQIIIDNPKFNATRLSLPPLPAEHIQQLGNRLLGTILPEEVVEFISEKSQGVPLFMVIHFIELS